MESPTIRVSKATHELLRAMAAEADTTMAAVVDEAVRAYRRRKFWDDYRASYEALRGDPESWAAHLRERDDWDATLGDGLEDPPDEQGPARRPEGRRRPGPR